MERNIIFKLRLTREEYERLKRLAEKDTETKTKTENKNMSAYIRKCIFSQERNSFDLKKELQDLKYQIRKIGVNINQVAAKGNKSYVTEKDITILRESLHMVEIQFLETIRKIEETYGDH